MWSHWLCVLTPGKTSTASFCLTLIRSNSCFNTWNIKDLRLVIGEIWDWAQQLCRYLPVQSRDRAPPSKTLQSGSTALKERTLTVCEQVTRSQCFTDNHQVLSFSIVTWCYHSLVPRCPGLHSGWRSHNYSLKYVKKHLFFRVIASSNISHFVFSCEVSTASHHQARLKLQKVVPLFDEKGKRSGGNERKWFSWYLINHKWPRPRWSTQAFCVYPSRHMFSLICKISSKFYTLNCF